MFEITIRISFLLVMDNSVPIARCLTNYSTQHISTRTPFLFLHYNAHLAFGRYVFQARNRILTFKSWTRVGNKLNDIRVLFQRF